MYLIFSEKRVAIMNNANLNKENFDEVRKNPSNFNKWEKIPTSKEDNSFYI